MTLNRFSQKATNALQTAMQWVPDPVAQNLKLRAFSVAKIPMIAFTNPKILSLNDRQVVIRIPLNYRTKNHLHSMYFGALAVGADLAVGLFATRFIDQSGERVNLIFKDFQAEYLKRAEGDVHFICEQGQEVSELVRQACEQGERVEKTIEAYATVPDKLFDEPVARFRLTLSLKKRQRSSSAGS